MTCDLAKKGFNKYSLFLPSPSMMSQRRCFVSEFGGIPFPSLAVFRFRVWRCLGWLNSLESYVGEFQYVKYICH